ncbi:MAG: leucine-rich repeat protein [Acutalibacteraceae bacterium]
MHKKISGFIAVMLMAVMMCSFFGCSNGSNSLVGFYLGEDGSNLRLKDDGTCIYWEDDSTGRGAGEWYVKDNTVYVNVDNLSYTIKADLSNQDNGLFFTSDSSRWNNERFSKLDPNEKFIYKFSDSYVEIKKYIGDDAEVIIPDKVENLPVKYLGSYAFRGYTHVTSVTIPDTVTSLATGTFEGCTELTNVTIRSMSAVIYDLPKNATIYCYAGSEAEKYYGSDSNYHIQIITE